MFNPQIIVLDFGSQYTQLIARRLREIGVYTEIMPYFESAESIRAKNPRGLILSGGPASVYEKDAYKPDSEIFSLGIPILGICYGMQYIAHFFGGQVAKSNAQEFGKAKLRILDSRESSESSGDSNKDSGKSHESNGDSSKDSRESIESNGDLRESSKIFSGVKQDSIVWMSHSDKVIALPSGFSAIGSSENSEICAIADFARKIYAIQFHPEVTHSECGAKILENFALNICGAKNDWNMHNFAEIEIAKIREIVGLENTELNKTKKAEVSLGNFAGCADTSEEIEHKGSLTKRVANSRKSAKETTPSKVLCAVSGGVDSSVVATLLHRAIGENLIPVFVDTGLLRAGEREAVEQMFKQNLKIPLITADASELFLSRLKGITEPEQKRKIIGKSFIEVFEREAKAHNANGEIKFLAQGTLYPDVIESVSVKGPSKTIKSHHNVGGLPEWMRFELIEPLRELFKDEVRSLGRELGVPESMLMRHPFPGPGLAIRIMGEVTRESLAILRGADSIFIEELHKSRLYNTVWQAFCVLLNVRSVGVMGDNRTYDNTIALRAVEAIDGMTARFSHLPFGFLEKVSNRIINEVKGINRVVYDISSKPPATIEWE